MTTLIRPASVHDAARLRMVHAESRRAAYADLMPAASIAAAEAKKDADWYRTMITDPGSPRAGTWVAEADGEIVGLAHFHPSPDEDLGADTGHLGLFYFVPEAWGTGAARRLLDSTLDDMRSLEFRATTLWVFVDNPRARRFYERAGFTEDGGFRQIDFGEVTLAELRYRLPL